MIEKSKRSLFLLPVGIVALYFVAGLIVVKIPGMSSIVGTVILDVLFGLLCWKLIMRPSSIGDGRSVLGLPVRPVLWLGLVVVWLFGQITASWIFMTTGDSLYETYTNALHNDADVWVSLLLTVLVAPVFEEVLFRGIVFPSWSRLNPWFGFIGSSIAFALMHGTLVHLPATFMTGLLLASAYAMTGELRTSIMLHVGYNLAASVLGSASVPAFFFLPAVFVVIDVCIVTWLCMEYRKVLSRTGFGKENSYGSKEIEVGEEAHDIPGAFGENAGRSQACGEESCPCGGFEGARNQHGSSYDEQSEDVEQRTS